MVMGDSKEKSSGHHIYESTIVGQRSGQIVSCSVAGYNSPFEFENRVNEVRLWFHIN
ncbi:hypothetical protein ACOSQ4_032089 [Xanthoceras sorbifolium]